MKEDEFHRYVRFFLALSMLMVMGFTIQERYIDHQIDVVREREARGVAISNYLEYHLNMEVAPEDARFLNINTNQYDIQIEDLDVFGRWNND